MYIQLITLNAIKGIDMAKEMKNFRLESELLDGLACVAARDFNGNMTAALEDVIKHSLLVRSVPEADRDRLRVSAKRGSYSEEYDKHERKMIDFFLV